MEQESGRMTDSNAIRIIPYFAPGERYPSIIGVKADGDEYELAYVRKDYWTRDYLMDFDEDREGRR